MARTSWIHINDYIILTEAEKVSLNALNLRDLEELEDLDCIDNLERMYNDKLGCDQLVRGVDTYFNDIIGPYLGAIYTVEAFEAIAANSRLAKNKLSYFMMINVDFNIRGYVDARKCGNLTRYINHSCNPNSQYRL